MAPAASPVPRGVSRWFSRALVVVFLAAVAGSHASTVLAESAARTFPGILLPSRSALIKSKVDESVSSVNVRVGSTVRRGDVLVQLDDREERIQRERAAAVLEREAANLNRVKELHAQGGASEEALETAQTRHRLAKADAALADTRLAELRIRAPFGGVVAERYVDQGTSVEVGDPLVRITALHPLRVEILLPEDMLPFLRGVTEATLIPSFPETSLAVTFDSGTLVVDPASGTFPVEMQVDNREGALVPGVSCRVVIAPANHGP